MKVAVLLGLSVLALAAPPPTEKKPVTETLHGVTLTDPYRWLEDQNSPETRKWIETQNAYTDKFLATLPGREALRKIIAPYYREDSVGTPTVRGGRYFFTRRLAEENRTSICVREGFDGKERVLIAPGTVSPDPAVSIGMQGVSDDGKLLIYFVRQGGEDETEIRFFDVEAGKDAPDRLPRARRFGVALTPDKKAVFYSVMTKDGTRVMRHRMGAEANSDEFVFSKGRGLVPNDAVTLSEDGRYLLLSLNYGTSSRTELRFIDLSSGMNPVTVVEGVDAQFFGSFRGGQLYVQTNWKAPNWRVLRIDPSRPSLDAARETIAEREVVLQGTSYAGGRIFARYLESGRPRILQVDPDGKPLGELPVPGIGVAGAPSGRWNSNEAFFSFSSFSDPETTYRLDIGTGKRDVWHKSNVRVPVEIETKQVRFNSKDGTPVPMWIVHRKGLKLDGNRPVYLTGYGGFNLPQLPAFNSTAAVWAELDGVYALPSLRGGGEFGEKWHKAGMFDKKQNVFDDFVGAAEWLIANGYTKPARIAAAGGSNGGLLVGAMLTQRPDLVGAVVCGAPLLDMVRFHRTFLGRFWVSEYGTAEDPNQFPYLLKYSPYQNVKPGTKYPAVLLHTGDGDTRVDPMHARKMTAMLQAANASDRPVLLKYDTRAGHSGGLPTDRLIDEVTDRQLFALTQVGVSVAAPGHGAAGLKRHDDLMIVYREAGLWKADYYDNEGHVIRHQVDVGDEVRGSPAVEADRL